MGEQVSQPSLTHEELRKGIILLYCFHCKKTTKHQTLDKHGKPVYPPSKRAPVAVWRKGRWHTLQYARVCLECGNVTWF